MTEKKESPILLNHFLITLLLEVGTERYIPSVLCHF